MGVFSPFSKHSSDESSSTYAEPIRIETRSRQSINPNPTRFKILKSRKIGNFAVMFINYPNCTNYEGNKILVFEGISIKALKERSVIDPHFTDSKFEPHLVARFEPTDKGWGYAIKFCKNT
jgi:hypothetical protein